MKGPVGLFVAHRLISAVAVRFRTSLLRRLSGSVALPLVGMCLVLAACSNPIAEKCERVCNRMVGCSVRQGMASSPEVERRLQASCLDGCARFQAEVFSCNDENPDSCEGLGMCMMSTGVMNE